MSPDSRDEPTLPIQLNTSDPVEIARKHREGHPSEEMPDKIGPYKILAYLGGGGMGLVYLAEQGTPARHVAIKIIPPRRRTKEILGRFDIEREALALMDHPNIAKVFGAGESDDGRPYFIMEYVKGIPITEYCDKAKLSTDERLGLFIDVCRAVHHAHQKGIIHRDIKPSNVLVAIQEDRPIPKVIDFGVAKAIGHHLTAHSVFTELGQLIGTPEYMSPEQAEMGPLDIDTRTDIYSLGVLLYELLVGAQPFDSRKLREAGYGEILRVIREVDPPTPSTRLSSLGGGSTVVALNRSTAVRSLSRELRGDLDLITMKCLEKDRVHRYDSATALADDVLRHLRAEPILAGPHGTAYKVKKFVRRHKFGVAAGTAIAAALIAGFAGTTVQYVRANREWKRAEEKAATAAEVTGFMVDDLFKVSDPSVSLGETIPVREILDRGAARIQTQLSSRPLVQAAMMDAIGSVYSNLGLYKEAEELLRKAVEIRKRELPAMHYDTATSLHHLGVLLDTTGDYAGAEACHQEGLAICDTLYGREHVATSESLAHLAINALARDKWDEAEQLSEDVLATRLKLLPPDDLLIASALFDSARIAHSRRELAIAKDKYERAAAIYAKRKGPNDPRTVDCRYCLADVAYKSIRYEEATHLYAEVLESFEKLYGLEDTHVAACLNAYATLELAKKNFDQAEALARRGFEINKKKLGPEHLQIASDLNLIGGILRKKGNPQEALPYHQASLDMRIRLAQNAAPNKDHNGMVAVSRQSLGSCYVELSRFEDAENEFIEAVRIIQSNPRYQWRLSGAYERMADLYDRWGKPDQATLYQNMVKSLKDQTGAKP